MKRLLIIAMILCLSSVFVAGCYTTGKVAGDTVQGVQDGAKDLKKATRTARKTRVAPRRSGTSLPDRPPKL